MNADSPIIERKVKPDGSVREYACELVRASEGLVVVRFEMAGAGSLATPVPIPEGAYSIGLFWKRRPFNAYRLTTSEGEVLAHRFDAVKDVRFAPGLVEYHDLVLDWWALPDGTLIEEDTEELAEMVASGGLSARDQLAALAAARAVTSRYRHIIDELDRLVTRLQDSRGIVP